MNRRLPKCILHIGMPKSGSTSIQHFLRSNASFLADRGFHVPLVAPGLANLPAWAFMSWRNNAKFLAKRKIQNPSDQEALIETLSAQYKEIINSDHGDNQKYLISSEHLFRRMGKYEDLLQLKQFLNQYFCEITVVAFIREPSSYVVSSYSQALMSGSTISFDQWVERFLNGRTWRYHSICSLWASVFGMENCIFEIFAPRDVKNYDVVDHFRKTIGFHDEYMPDLHGSRENIKLNHRLMLAYRVINTIKPKWIETDGGYEKNRNRQIIKKIKKMKIFQSKKQLTINNKHRRMLDLYCADEMKKFLTHYASGRSSF